MISYLKGKIINKGQGYIILEIRDIGYKVFINDAHYSEINIGDETELYTYQNVREDALDLYGFKSLEQLEMFELLLTISGIGPKSALGVLAAASIDDIKESIARGDSGLLIKVSGIGKKTAERVVLELREKIGVISGGRETKGYREGAMASGEEIDALMALGYSMPQARDALKSVDPKIKDTGERIKAALKSINN
ncbi:Holliday junction branch migration protein RuvA [Candidatus Falkowbacteria bacterium]|nr:MAG: Holliday junction branch migration protein RuvA [Candidatus Falkowbacteria bacterium]